MGFLYQGNTDILNLPIERHGLDFPSITHINLGLVTEGLAHDLNHHIPAYQQVELITLADWTCSINNCVGPLDGLGLRWNFTQYYKKTPAAWIIAQNTLTYLEPKLSLHHTDASHIFYNDVSISHTLRLCQAHGVDVPDGHAIWSITTKGIRTLSDTGKWMNNKSGKLTFAISEDVATQTCWTPKAREHWDNIATILRKMDTTWLFDGDLTLMMPRTQCQAKAEDYIRSLPSILFLPLSSLPHQNHTWGSDGSMIPATSRIREDKSVTATIMGPKTIVVRLSGCSLFILHGELIGLVMGLVLLDNETLNNKLFTDHLNSTRFIDDTRMSINQENHL